MDVFPDSPVFSRTNVAASCQSLIQTTVADAHPAEMRRRHAFAAGPFEGKEVINIGDQIVHHATHNARLCVQVNQDARRFVRAAQKKDAYKCAMTARPIDRIAAAILVSGTSLSQISVSAGLGRNFVSQLLKNEKAPKSENLVSLSEALGIEASWTITGHPGNPKLDSLLRLFSHLDFVQKQKTFKTLAPGTKQTLETLSALAAETKVPVEKIQSWISESEEPKVSKEDAKAFDELISIANGQEIDMEVMREALHEAYQIEIELLGGLGPADKRAKLVSEIYELKMATGQKNQKTG